MSQKSDGRKWSIMDYNGGNSGTPIMVMNEDNWIRIKKLHIQMVDIM